LRIAFRGQPARVKYAWLSFLSTLLMVSGIVSTVAAIFVFAAAPLPSFVNTGLPELDERGQFPSLPSTRDLNSAEVSTQLKPLVIVVSPAARLWNRQVTTSGSFGAGFLLHADHDGYLFATANHVVAGAQIALISTQTDVWAKANVVGREPQRDLALLWMVRHSGSGDFVQPLAAAEDGENVFVIGHPEGLKYTLSTGIISGLREGVLQLTAAVSPGNSGGPVYDAHGNLAGIVSSKFDRNQDANAENLGFASKSDGLQLGPGWNFTGNGKEHLQHYLAALKQKD
jgi:S1-C subfamily serine protease